MGSTWEEGEGVESTWEEGKGVESIWKEGKGGGVYMGGGVRSKWEKGWNLYAQPCCSWSG